MPSPSQPEKIVYLFGAGATHAELQNLNLDLDDAKKEQKLGLLIRHVSARVLRQAETNKRYQKNLGMISGGRDDASDVDWSLNIELLIGLIENSKVADWEYKSHKLKMLVQADIERVLSRSRKDRFFLHKALFEFHKQPAAEARERLTGLISLNYDTVLDEAYKQFYGPPNHCLTFDDQARASDAIPLLKLHGSFGWRGISMRGRKRTVEIIPLGSAKNYLHSPYSFIWTRAFEALIGCDTLRVVGCSLSPNDAHLIDLLFKAHLERPNPFTIEIIDFDKTGERIRKDYGFFPEIKTLSSIEAVADATTPSPFKTWLKYRSLAILGDTVQGRYLKRVVE